MRTLYVGSKQPASKSKASLGTKVYGGIKSMGQKVYDNRWKIMGSGASLAANAAMKYMSGSSGVGENNLGQTVYAAEVVNPNALAPAYRFNRGSV
jgi:hypothetical protein|tara:strand:- start:2307 stop:2591 length:285 start_codon:yes stop_codon:yes gene_type:complete